MIAVVVKYRVKPQKPRFETAKNPVFMRVFKVRGLSRSLSPKPPALPAAPHPDIYSIFGLFAWKWDKLWSNANSTLFCVFIKCRKSAPLKAFQNFRKISAIRAGHAPKCRALPTAPHPDLFNFMFGFLQKFRNCGTLCGRKAIIAHF